MMKDDDCDDVIMCLLSHVHTEKAKRILYSLEIMISQDLLCVAFLFLGGVGGGGFKHISMVFYTEEN